MAECQAIAGERAAGYDQYVILTPKPGTQPRINGSLVYGCRPGHLFIYRIPCQGARPIIFSAKGLPQGLRLDPST